jgi:iron complex outermembrane recepter protein
LRRSLALVALLSGIAPTALYAQNAPAAPATPPSKPHRATPPQSEDDGDDSDIVVTGSRKLPGSVVGDIPPEQTLGPADVRSFGVSSIGDLLNELAPETRSDRGSGGAPVVLLSGRRIGSFAEIRDLPTEAIARVEILPEEVALSYGYRADQRVVNIVLRRRFKAITGELGDKVATAGGRNTPSGAVDVLTINRAGRFSLHTAYSESSALFENERTITALPSDLDPGIVLPDGPIDERPYRTLLPETRTYTTNAVLARTIFSNVSATLNGSVTYNESNSAQGLPDIRLAVPAGNPFSPYATDVEIDRAAMGLNPLAQRNSTLAWSLNGSMNGDFSKKWRWTLTANYDRSTSQTFTERGLDMTAAQALIDAGDPTFNPFGPIDLADYPVLAARHVQSTSNAGVVTAVAQGALFKLPAGDVTTSITANGSLSSLDATAAPTITRNTINGLANIDFPITSRSKGVLGAIGDLSINGNVEVDSVSGFRTLTTTGYGVHWSPISALRVIVSFTNAQDAPSATQLGGAVVVTPNVRVFDYVKGETVNVTSTSGGNPFLDASDKHTFKLGMTLKPLDKQDLTITANYIATHTRNSLASFPAATAAVEAAFPDRFTRDPVTDDLIAVNMRPVNFDRIEHSELRWGINFSAKLKSKLQKEFEAFRAGNGPNPLAGLRPPGGGRRFGDGQSGDGQSGAGAQGETPQNGIPGGGQSNGAGDQSGGGRPGGGGGRGFGGGGRGFGGGRGGGGGFGGGGGRLQMALYHTWHFTDRVDIAPGVPVIDLLNGGAIGSGGQSRHELEGQLGYNNNGLGVRFSANWKSGTQVLGGTPGNPNTLDFSALGTISMRLFADLSQQLEFIKKHPWARGMRVTVGFSNLLDSRQKVRDATGETPISYQPDYLDPLGRTVQVSIRKMFF